ncbi:glycerol-3-phosphate dehydrogenase/oxidase [Acidiferrimicrobium sp. IK]|uniref:glycerol-3-phosphate dehydrogenase/oxidase n=1 Tax=Acidiferrimicrobium sp. IK TaxID=2871700 RepID=UPI0039673C83
MSAEHLDVLVVGGGVVGAGAALDAATRGLNVGLVEARDWAAGTSSRSSKLIHGGLRYLEMLDFRLVREALVERGLLLQRLAPHLVTPVPFIYPLRAHWERPYVGAGLVLYDTLSAGAGWGRGLPRHQHLSRREAQRRFPALRDDALVGAVQYWDAQVDDARHTMTVVRTAAAYGAAVANRAQLTDMVKEGGVVVGAAVRDLETGSELTVRARQVINATGVWTDDTQALADGRSDIHVRAAKGVHLVVPRDRIDGEAGLILRTEKSVLFVIPWAAHWLIGTTDTDWALDLAHPAASAADIDYLLERVNRVLRTGLSREDIEGVYAGLRPLLSGEQREAGEAAPTTKISREHMVSRAVPGLVVVAGGKYTTYRVMARDAVDAAAAGLGRPVPESCTERVPLLGAEGYAAMVNSRERLATASSLPVATIDHLLGRYGSLISEVLALIADRPELAEALPGGPGYLAAEVVYAATAEGARHVEDVLMRRTRLSFEGSDRGVSTARRAAALMGEVLGWDDALQAREVEFYLGQVEAERRAEKAPDDRAADSSRLEAPDPVPTVPLRPSARRG